VGGQGDEHKCNRPLLPGLHTLEPSEGTEQRAGDAQRACVQDRPAEGAVPGKLCSAAGDSARPGLECCPRDQQPGAAGAHLGAWRRVGSLVGAGRANRQAR
jgi:hypothetical protein